MVVIRSPDPAVTILERLYFFGSAGTAKGRICPGRVRIINPYGAGSSDAFSCRRFFFGCSSDAREQRNSLLMDEYTSAFVLKFAARVLVLPTRVLQAIGPEVSEVTRLADVIASNEC